jgi:hypothetical protein
VEEVKYTSIKQIALVAKFIKCGSYNAYRSAAIAADVLLRDGLSSRRNRHPNKRGFVNKSTNVPHYRAAHTTERRTFSHTTYILSFTLNSSTINYGIAST